MKSEYEADIHELIDEYDNNSFWEELPRRLAERDLFNEIGKVTKLTDVQRTKLYEIEERYSNEFQKNGLKNVTLLKVLK